MHVTRVLCDAGRVFPGYFCHLLSLFSLVCMPQLILQYSHAMNALKSFFCILLSGVYKGFDVRDSTFVVVIFEFLLFEVVSFDTIEVRNSAVWGCFIHWFVGLWNGNLLNIQKTLYNNNKKIRREKYCSERRWNYSCICAE